MKARTPLPLFDAPEPVMKMAGAWLARRDRGFTAAEFAEFEQWRRANPSHAAAVAQLERTMSTFDRLRELAPTDRSTPDRDAFAPVRPSRRWVHAMVAASGIAAAIAWVFWVARPAPASGSWHFATGADGYQRAALADGSSVELNGETTVDIDFTARERRVRLLRGEAHFHVSKDPSRPFVVQAKSVAVSAVGTAFNVRLAPAGVEVLVTEGRVRVEPPASRRPATVPSNAPVAARTAEIPLLTAGDKVVVPTIAEAEPTRIARVSAEEMQRALAWQTRVAQFRQTPLSEAVAKFNRHNERQIVILDPELERLRIGGSFRTDQPEAFVRLLETSFGIAAKHSGARIVLRNAPDESP